MDEKCALHDSMEKALSDAKKEYRWVVGIAIASVITAISWVNVQSSNRFVDSQKIIKKEIEATNKEFQTSLGPIHKTLFQLEKILDKLVHSHTEVRVNQNRILNQLELEAEMLPDYNDDG